MERVSIPKFILAVLYLIIVELSCYGYTYKGNCIQTEREALVDFKSGMKDPNKRLLSWKGANYCLWLGITCENGTGFVISIDLHNPYPRQNIIENWNSMSLSGEIRPSLGQLKHLKYLDLSFNSFQDMPIPQFFRSLENLVYLNLSCAGFYGEVPSNLGNLSNLQYLDLSNLDYFHMDLYSYHLSIEDIEWLSSLLSLKYLSLDLVDLASVGSKWAKVLNRLSNLTELHLSHCHLSGSFPFGLGDELPNLQYLDLSLNFHLLDNFSQLPLSKSWRKLEFLNLGGIGIFGSIPSTIANFCNLKYLNLSQTFLNGSLPDWFGEIKNLRVLDLSSNYLEGPILDSLWTLQHLEYLDLRGNDLNGSIPSSIGNLCNLRYLDLSENPLNGSLPQSIEGHETCGCKSVLPNLMQLLLMKTQLTGKLPNWLGEVKNLRALDLSSNQLEGPIPYSLGTLQHIESLSLRENKLTGSLLKSVGQLSRLKILDVSSNLLSGTLSEQHFWNQSKLQYLEYLNLGGNELNGSIPSSIGNLCNLRYLDLSYNGLDGSLPQSIEGHETCSGKSALPNLMQLYLMNTRLKGKLPNWLGEVRNLKELHLYDNQLEGPIPDSLGTLQHLEYLYLGWNNLTGSLPKSIGQLSRLQVLDVSHNHLSGTLSEQHFWNLSKLETLDTGSNSFHLNVSPNWIPPFQIQYLDMGSCHLGPSFPTWVQSQNNLGFLYFSNSSISSPIPNWIWSFSLDLVEIDLSHNQIHGQIPNSLNFSHSKLSGPLLRYKVSFPGNGLRASTRHLTSLETVDLSNNNLTGVIPNSIGNLTSLVYIQFSKNNLRGSIPDSIGHLTSLQVIDLSKNNLIGRIPSVLNNCSGLVIIDVGNNNLSREIPKSLGHLQSLQSLHLNHNKLSGKLPPSFQNLSSLEVFHASNNKLSSEIPTWIGFSLPNLVILDLSLNMFSGRLPSQLSNLSSLHVLDIAHNNLMGEIPLTLGELKAMAQENLTLYELHQYVGASLYEERLVIETKGQSLEYTRTLSLVLAIDLSNNNLSGRLPEGITKLSGLVVLNLSRNHITGQIPENISMLRQLSSLDLSSNELSGSIPSSMVILTFLGYLNLSENKLSGKIPFIGQMTTFDEISFVGNCDLCGPPLVRTCQDEDSSRRELDVDNKNDGGCVDQWFYLNIGLGFAAGILVPYFVLVIRKSWCEAYFDFVDGIVKWLLRGRMNYTKHHRLRRG